MSFAVFAHDASSVSFLEQTSLVGGLVCLSGEPLERTGLGRGSWWYFSDALL